MTRHSSLAQSTQERARNTQTWANRREHQLPVALEFFSSVPLVVVFFFLRRPISEILEKRMQFVFGHSTLLTHATSNSSSISSFSSSSIFLLLLVPSSILKMKEYRVLLLYILLIYLLFKFPNYIHKIYFALTLLFETIRCLQCIIEYNKTFPKLLSLLTVFSQVNIKLKIHFKHKYLSLDACNNFYLPSYVSFCQKATGIMRRAQSLGT